MDHVKSKVDKIVGIFNKLKVSLPNYSLKLLYTALLLPYLHYFIVVWAGGHQNTLKPIHFLQKRVVRLCRLKVAGGPGPHFHIGPFTNFLPSTSSPSSSILSTTDLIASLYCIIQAGSYHFMIVHCAVYRPTIVESRDREVYKKNTKQ